MNQISIDQLKSRITATVGIIVFAVICISALGVVTECTSVAGAGGLATEPRGAARLLDTISLKQSVLTLVLCLVILILTRILFRHLNNLKATQSIVDGQQAELAIKAAQIDAANDSILQIDEEGRLVHFNQALCRLTGYRPEELSGVRLHEIEPPEYASQIEPIIRKLKRYGEATFESAYLSKNGTVIPIEVHSRLMESEGRTLILNIARDITQRKRGELMERSRLKTLERIATDASLEELLVCVVHFVEQGSPGALCSVLLVDESGNRLRHGAAPSLPDQYNKAVEPHPYWRRFQPARDAGLRACWSEPVFASNGTLLGTVAVYHREPCAPTEEEILLIESAAHLAGIAIGRVRADDGHRVLEEQLRHSQKIEAVGQLAAGVAHDFNNLLTPIIVYADMLRRSFAEGSPQARMLDSVSLAAHKASDLTQKLLSFGRKQVLDMDLLDLNDVIVSFRDIMRATARESISIDLRLSPGATKVYADRGQLEQILLNLLLNAQDAIEGSGSICLETGHLILDEDFARQHPVAKPGHYILLAFSDDGCGMAEETLRHMYEPFFTTKVVGRGTGLGLATVYGIVKHHEGCIDVKSRPGEGTRFEIYLPASSSADEPILGTGPRLLTSFGYQVLCADSPAQALELAARQGGLIHLLATDVIMPGMTGPELYEKLLESHPALPVLYISGYTNGILHDASPRQEAIFLAKPFTMEQFMERIGELCAAALGEADAAPLDHAAMAGLLRNKVQGNKVPH